MDGFGAGKGSLPRPVDTQKFSIGYDAINFSSLRKEEPKPTATEVLNLRLRILALWCEKRAASEHCVETTLTMLRKKVAEVEAFVRKA
jgi:hypothetical protein